MKKFALTFVAAFSALGIAAQTSTRCAVFFPSDKYDLNQETCSTLDTLISFLNGKKSITVSITGHTDSTATEAYNQTLSKNRARTVTVYLAGKGIDPACITFIGLGEGSPVAGNNTEEGRQKNRRVELLVSWAAPEKPKRHGSGFALETEKKQKTWDSVLFTDNGIIVKIDKCSFDRELSEIDFNITGALYKDDMLANNLTTVDNNGNCLVSGGMVLLEAWYNGMQIDMNGGCPIEINIPSDRVDPQMDIYKSKTYEEGNVVWEKTKIVTDDEEGYYSFPIT
ncbi:MAG: OmpA family protein [Bacteroidetes bacterium]|nr:OmpA family protein [Bacteroidota bacterium]